MSCSIGRSISLLGISPHLFLSPRLETDAVVGAAPTAWVARIAKGEEDEGGSSSPPRASHPETSRAHLSPAETTRTQAAPARQAVPMDGRFSREFSVSTSSVVHRVTPGNTMDYVEDKKRHLLTQRQKKGLVRASVGVERTTLDPARKPHRERCRLPLRWSITRSGPTSTGRSQSSCPTAQPFKCRARRVWWGKPCSSSAIRPTTHSTRCVTTASADHLLPKSASMSQHTYPRLLCAPTYPVSCVRCVHRALAVRLACSISARRRAWRGCLQGSAGRA